MTGLCEGFSHHQPVSGKCDEFTSGTHLCLFMCVHESHICVFCLFVPSFTYVSPFFPISLPPPLLSLSMYTSFSRFPPCCQPCHLPIAPLPSRVRSRVLTLGFVQICSLRGWEVVVRAKKNSLALSLTTRLVFQMKPNENSIFYPCYSLPPILHPSLPACIPPSPPLVPPICRLISHSCLCLFNTLAQSVKVSLW